MTAAVLAATQHRPWPLPRRPWLMVQVWEHVFFAHWPVPADALAPHLPPSVEIDRFAGDAWITVTPLVVTVRPRGLPPIPFVSRFAELNLRTYVVRDGKPGVWFFSLDAASVLAVIGARLGYSLPYFTAVGGVTTGPPVHHRLRRIALRAPGFEARYEPSSRPAPPAGRDAWLTERYCLYTTDRRGRLYRGDIHHPPWTLQRARAEIVANTIAEPLGIRLADPPRVTHYSARQDVVVWALERVV